MSELVNQAKTTEDRGHLTTEKRLDASSELDTLSTEGMLHVMNGEDAKIAAAVEKAVPAIAGLVDSIVERMKRGGRIMYIGAGTSGRLGVLDASEIPPTFQADPSMVVGIIAGGDGALRKSSESKEDVYDGSYEALDELGVNGDDVMIGIAAGGTTPYVWGALEYVKKKGGVTGFVSCVELGEIEKRFGVAVDHKIELIVGPEVVTGSTRMKSGTVTKLALNMISTITMVKLGKVWGNLMVDVKATNAKLVDRAVRMLMGQTELEREDAAKLLEKADGHVKVALVMQKKGINAEEARSLLTKYEGVLHPILGRPR
ncbi:N-acetylmuramic acid 6-phosphate etherase [Poriferisphaera corsica]|uniref:N-acetylmuramic acid 6-phosphate etherase n=1 Tax=Poriferisphaera corsica TaxID=2528020 RepID=A0A517YYH9_9BACT|nr:N-acetylmuramic acid 6-phosphate etherase [Poriferisphaera corsica]QDU35257.1 N-acetylmuramic acid 6-phosphate etherase [Poriferisphaera corsica]